MNRKYFRGTNLILQGFRILLIICHLIGILTCSQYDPNLYPPQWRLGNSRIDSAKSREFEKLNEAQFVGKWQGNFLSNNGGLANVDLEVQRSDEFSFLCQLRVNNGSTRQYYTRYQMGLGILQGDGMAMTPIQSGFAEIQVKDNPDIPNDQVIKLLLTKS